MSTDFDDLEYVPEYDGGPDECPRCHQDYLDEDGQCDYCLYSWDDPEDDGQPDFMFEHDSSMASVGWGTDEDYGYYGDDYDY